MNGATTCAVQKRRAFAAEMATELGQRSKKYRSDLNALYQTDIQRITTTKAFDGIGVPFLHSERPYARLSCGISGTNPKSKGPLHSHFSNIRLRH